MQPAPEEPVSKVPENYFTKPRQHKDGEVVRIFVRKGKVCLVHRTAKLSIQSPSIGKLNDDGRVKGSGHQDSILFQETRWSVTGGEEKVERSKRENSEVEQMGGGAPFSELCQLCGFEEIVEANTCVARCEQLSVHCSRVL